ncbi:MAG: hypothetical protein COB93_02460 [Sneathiella sp.]|nr:MAG: hypothetical protein COB93_02460 [Sneathiella sp.]
MGWLTIDPSTNTGIAFYEPGQPVHTETWKLGAGKACHGQIFKRFLINLRRFCATHNVTDIAIEGQSFNSVGSLASKNLREGWLPMTHLFCFQEKLPAPRDVPPAKWRTYFIGVGRAPKHISKNAKTKWLKDKAMEKCRERGIYPANDDEGDAVGILFWASNGGPEEQAKKRAEKKQASLEKRRQTKMDLQPA